MRSFLFSCVSSSRGGAAPPSDLAKHVVTPRPAPPRARCFPATPTAHSWRHRHCACGGAQQHACARRPRTPAGAAGEGWHGMVGGGRAGGATPHGAACRAEPQAACSVACGALAACVRHAQRAFGARGCVHAMRVWVGGGVGAMRAPFMHACAPHRGSPRLLQPGHSCSSSRSSSPQGAAAASCARLRALRLKSCLGCISCGAMCVAAASGVWWCQLRPAARAPPPLLPARQGHAGVHAWRTGARGGWRGKHSAVTTHLGALLRGAALWQGHGQRLCGTATALAGGSE